MGKESSWDFWIQTESLARQTREPERRKTENKSSSGPYVLKTNNAFIPDVSLSDFLPNFYFHFFVSERTPNRRLPISSTPQPQPTYTDQMQSLPEPPPYTIAMQRLRFVPFSRHHGIFDFSRSVDQQPQESFRDAYIRKSVNDTLQRRYRQRSSSLPRGNKSYYEGIDMYDVQPPILPPTQQSSLLASIHQLPGSLDNLHITVTNWGQKTHYMRPFQNQLNMGGMRRRKLPTAPLMGSSCQLHLKNSDELTAYRALQFQMMQDELQRSVFASKLPLKETSNINFARNG